ncbi:MarR family winged helix-turn-helix transcriptional regulator [Neolewinella agarilytica]|uniref:Transcriptional regulator, MarR family n=1 Tax=Neolewinella agarilytica TaxID=478744 RepID=A0A1H8Z264_9BACT|nr:MarR family transcriptional regulator [Neolewinella agarilytica]SEP58431.1 transcriptional regulator, MarR family [Neolewinella agarilytica]
MPGTKPHDLLIFLTNRVGRQLSRLMLEQMEFEGFLPQSTHMGLVADLVGNDGLRQQDLAISTIKDKGTVARALKQLESAGLLMRQIDADDRRQKLIRLTDKGNRLWQFAQSKATETMVTATHDIEQTEFDTCIDVLKRVYQNLHQQLSIPQTSSHE